MPGQHARLAPSAAHRWMNCAAAPNLEATMPKYSTTYADEGTVLHDVMSQTIPVFHERRGDARTSAKAYERVIGKRLTSGDDVRPIESATTEQAEALEWCLGVFYAEVPERAHVMVEQRVRIPGRDDCYGTSDVIAYLPELRRLVVIDWKFGAGVQVFAKDNEQAIIYALGALCMLDDLADIDEVVIVIAQPRLDHHDRWVLSACELRGWLPRIIEAAARTDSPGAPTDGDWCRFCSAQSSCPALRATAMQSARGEFSVLGAASETQLAEAMQAIPRIEAWIEEIRAEAFRRLSTGRAVPGYKLGEGRKRQEYTSPDRAAVWAELMVGADAFTVPELRSPAQLRTAAKRAGVPFDESLVTWTPGKPSVMPEGDGRSLLTAAQHEFAALPEDL